MLDPAISKSTVPPAAADPLVSVVMPCFNASATIGAAIQSVLRQTMDRLEILVCDDASTDGTAAALASIIDPRLRVIHNPHNLGPGASRDRAIALARAPWIAVIDSDDSWVPERLERMLAAAGADGKAMVFDDILHCHDDDGELIPWRRQRGPAAFGASGREAVDVDVAAFLRTERLLIKPLLPTRIVRDGAIRHSDRRYGEDSEFFLRVLAAGARLRYLPEALYLYRLTEGSATANPHRTRLMKAVLEEARELPGFGDAERSALDWRLERIRRHEVFANFAGALRAGRLSPALRLLAHEPWLVGRSASRLLQAAAYNISRIRKGLRPTKQVR